MNVATRSRIPNEGRERLVGKVALITGGSGGQGAAHARLFAGEGAHVVICDIADQAGVDLADFIVATGGSAEYEHLGITAEEAWDTVVAKLEQAGRPVDVLVNNAGMGRPGGVLDSSVQDMRVAFDVNVLGAFLGIKAVAPGMIRRRSGSIVNVGSIAAVGAYPAVGYSTSKWALRGLTKSAALELALSSVRVNAVGQLRADPGPELRPLGGLDPDPQDRA